MEVAHGHTGNRATSSRTGSTVCSTFFCLLGDGCSSRQLSKNAPARCAISTSSSLICVEPTCLLHVGIACSLAIQYSSMTLRKANLWQATLSHELTLRPSPHLLILLAPPIPLLYVTPCSLSRCLCLDRFWWSKFFGGARRQGSHVFWWSKRRSERLYVGALISWQVP